MNWSDIFYPGNPERRTQLIRRSQELRNLMENNFRATNKLGAVLNEHFGYSFSEITLNENADVNHNCDVFIERIHEIQAALEKLDQKMKDKLVPTLYEKLKKMDLRLNTSELATVATVAKAVSGVAGVGTGVAVWWLLKSGKILQNIVLKHGLLKSTLAAGVVISVVFLGIDMIVGAILGSIERDRLEHDLKEYDRALNEFKPASEDYQDSIYEVMAEIKMMKKKF